VTDKNSFLYGPKIIYGFVLLFLVVFFFYLITLASYAQSTEKNFVTSIKEETKLLIELKKQTTFDMAKSISLDKKLIGIMQRGEYAKLYNESFFPTAKRFQAFKHIQLHIVDKNGVNRYLSWTKKSLNVDVLSVRRDLRQLYKNPKPVSVISVGKFDLTFKGIMPIYSEEHSFLGVVEVITHFNSISEELKNDQIYSALVIEKRFTKQLVHAFSKVFIDGYNISTLHLHPDVSDFLHQKGIKFFLDNNRTDYLQKNLLSDGYYVTDIPVKGISGEVIGHFLVFIYDKYSLKYKERLLFLLAVVMSLLFFIVVYLVYKAYRKNAYLIDSLNLEVEKQTQRNLELIYRDALTGAYKKEKFVSDVKLYKEHNVVMLNIRNFSQINAAYGFDAGDEVLKIVAKKLKDILQKDIYRIDADEFVFVSNRVEEDIMNIIEAFKLSAVHLLEQNINLRLSFSFSVVDGSKKSLLSKLSVTLKKAKQEPFKPYVVYEKEEVDDRFIQFNAYLYDAIFTQNEARIVPYFQGIRDNRRGEIIKYESLARLDVNGKIYSPYFFIDIAKSSGFLFEITKIMIDKSFAYLADKDRNIVLSINITEDDLLSKTLQNHLLEGLKKYGLAPQQIVLEILEGVSSAGAKNNIKQLKELKELGFALAIDDFGVEYSNFERINELDVDFIKIDAKYIKNIDTNPKSYKIVKAITEFASSMGIKVIAEYVENESIQNIIEELNIEFSQGYYFSQPAPEFL